MAEQAGSPAGAGAGVDVDAAIRAHFTARAATYSGGGDESLQAMLDLAAPQPGERALDVATGTGLALFPLAQAVAANGLAVGVDFTLAMLEQAARRRGTGAASPALLAAHAARLPFAPGSFDLVTCRFSIHHFSDAESGLAAMAAALRPGGRLVVADFVRPEDPAEAARHDRLESLRGHRHVRIYEQARLEAMLQAAGCPVVARRLTEREMKPQDWLASPNVAPEAREPLARLIDELSLLGGAGLQVRRADGAVRFVRTDAVLLGIKRS